MKAREIILFCTAAIVFLLSWVLFMTIVGTAQGVGDAPDNFNPFIKSAWWALALTCAYGVVYYAIYWFIKLVKK